MIKVVTFFLIGMMVLALFGRLRLPKRPKLTTVKCPECGRYRIGRGKCDCAGKG